MVFWGNFKILSLLLSGVVLSSSTIYDLQHELERFSVEGEVADMRVGSFESEVMVKVSMLPQVSLAQMEELKSLFFFLYNRWQDKAGAGGHLQTPQCDVLKKRPR